MHGPLQTNDLFVAALYYLDPLIKDGYRLTVTEIKDFVSSLAEHHDPVLYNRYSKLRVLDNYSDTIQLFLSYRVNVPKKCAKSREMNVVRRLSDVDRRLFTPFNIS